MEKCISKSVKIFQSQNSGDLAKIEKIVRELNIDKIKKSAPNPGYSRRIFRPKYPIERFSQL